MNEEASSYLKDIQAGSPVATRVDELLEELHWMSPEGVERIFISDQIAQDTEDRLFTSLWMITPKYFLEAKQFLSNFDLDVAPVVSINYLHVKTADFSLRPQARTRKSSRMSVRANLSTGVHLGGSEGPMFSAPTTALTTPLAQSWLSATGKNCHYLAAIVRDLMVPRLNESPDSSN